MQRIDSFKTDKSFKEEEKEELPLPRRSLMLTKPITKLQKVQEQDETISEESKGQESLKKSETISSGSSSVSNKSNDGSPHLNDESAKEGLTIPLPNQPLKLIPAKPSLSFTHNVVSLSIIPPADHAKANTKHPPAN